MQEITLKKSIQPKAYKMKQAEVSKLSIEDLNEKLEIFRKNYVDLKMTHTISPLESPIQLRELRRTVARLTTELNKRD